MIVRGNPETESQSRPDPVMLKEMAAYNNSLKEAGVFITAEGLLGSSTAARIAFSSTGGPTVTRGPFDHSTLIAGFWLINAKSLDEAIAWAEKVPFKKEGEVVEVRKVASGEDFEELRNVE